MVLAASATVLLFSAPAHADNSSVTLFGILDEFAGRLQYAGQAERKVLNSGGFITSRWGVRGSEDLGDGLKANFNLTSLFRADTGEAGRFTNDAFWASRSTVGLSGRFGAVDFGRWNSPMFYALARFDSFELANIGPVFLHTYPGGQPVVAPQAAADGAINNGLIYSSPTIGGFRTVLHYGLAETTPFKGRFGYSLDYAIGNLTLGIAGDQIKAPLPAGEGKQTALMGGATYDFKVVKMYAIVKKERQELLGNTYHMYDLGFQVPVGLLKVIGTYTQTNLARTALPDVKRDTAALSLDYFLSKRTDIYAVATYDRVTNLSNGKTLVAGIRHAF